MQTTDFGDRDDRAEFRRLDWPSVGGILVEREVSARSVIVREVAGQGAAQVPFAEDEDVIQALPPGGADEAFREGVLPRAVGRGQDFTDCQRRPVLGDTMTSARLQPAHTRESATQKSRLLVRSFGRFTVFL